MTTAFTPAAALFAIICVLACDNATPPPTTGGIRVTSAMSGQDLDEDGYRVSLDGAIVTTLAPGGGTGFTTVRAGIHHLQLDGVAPNCTVGGSQNRQVNVTAGQVTAVSFVITCLSRTTDIPNTGTLEVTTHTTGVEMDRDGYTLRVWTPNRTVTSLFLRASGTILVNLESETHYRLELGGVATNCRVADGGPPAQSVELLNGDTATVRFELACDPSYPARLSSGTQLAFVRNGRIHLVNSDGTGIVSLTSGPADCDPAWSPDGARIAFVRNCNEANQDIYVMNADGSNVVRRSRGFRGSDPAWSPDGTRIAFAGLSYQGGIDVLLMNADDDGRAPTAITSFPGWDSQPAWSPDGSRIAFVTDKEFYDFVVDVFLIDLTDGQLTQVTHATTERPSLGQYFEPAWSPDGSTLTLAKCWLDYFVCPAGTLAVIPIDGSAPRDLAPIVGTASATWSPDGRTIAFSTQDYVGWIRADGSQRGFIVGDGHSPAWRPVATSPDR